ncbi:MAG: OmpA family protein [Flavobacteriia bacterium]|nr:OmpA family protein [Flavobacteriia bacterium]
MKPIFLIFSVCFLSYFFSQEEDESCVNPDKKVVRLIETAKNTPNIQIASENFNKAIDMAPENAMVYFEFAIYTFQYAQSLYEKNPNPNAGDKALLKAESLFKQCIGYCNDYHSDCFYYLGVINYNQKEMDEAITYFKEFVSFQHNNPARISENFDKKKKDAQEIIKEVQNDAELKTTKVPFEPKKVPNVSTTTDEYFPMISPDNELMFYTRKVNDNEGLGEIITNVVEKFCFSQRTDAEALFDKGQAFKPPFNDGSFSSYGAATMSVDNKEMIICACKNENVQGRNYMNCDLYITEFKRSGKGGNDFEWTPLKNMGPEINTPNGWEAQPSLSADGNTLFFTAYRPNTRDNDIFISKRDGSGNWSQAIPFDEINTDGKDKSPFLHQDSETLYFVSSTSDKRKGVGGLDIFYTRTENGIWQEPKNIGYPINSAEDELGIFVSIDGKLAYYSSRVGGDWNIYQFELYPEARPQKVAIMKGELKNNSGEPITDASIEIAYANSDKIETVKVKGDDGKYAAIVKTKEKQDVMLTVKKEGHAFDSKLITKEEISEKKSIKGNDLEVKPLKEGEAYTIKDILFGTASFQLSASSQFILKQFSRFLKENPSIKIAIQGHTDDVGEESTNLKLSDDRASAVKKYLVSLGIQESRLSAKGYGESKPKIPNDSDYSRSINRRTDFVIEKL